MEVSAHSAEYLDGPMKPSSKRRKAKGNGKSLESKIVSTIPDATAVHNNQLAKELKQKEIDDVASVLSYWAVAWIYSAYLAVFFFGLVREAAIRVLRVLGLAENSFGAPKGYAPLIKEADLFWLRRVYSRCRDCFERPIASAAGSWIKITDRVSHDENFSFVHTGTTSDCLNLSSYNYLGFCENTPGRITDSVAESIRRYGVATASPRMEGGNTLATQQLEEEIARFVGKPAAMVIGMGYATNSTTLPAFCGGKGTLIISDSLNHNSIVYGARDSGAVIKVFKHNNVENLETVLKDSIVKGQPRTGQPWKKIIVIVEGIYSMEGEIAKLPEIVALKKKYKAYLYVDEAHSIGALGQNGRGVCEQTGVNPDDVDVLMGTFTKAFGSVGGYIAASPDFIDYLRTAAYGTVYGTAMSPACAQQASSALTVIMGEDGTDEGKKRLAQLHENCNYFRQSLKDLGFHVFGDTNSPIVPMMIYHWPKLIYLSRVLLAKGIAVVIVGYPVTPVLLTRVRFCISAGHTLEDMKFAVEQISQVGDLLKLKYNKQD